MSNDVVESSPRSTRQKSDDHSTPKKKKSKKRRRRGSGNSPSTKDGGSDRAQASANSSAPTGSAIHATEAETDISSANESPVEPDTLVETEEKVCPIISYVTALFHTVI